jgi:hypothetical protein
LSTAIIISLIALAGSIISTLATTVGLPVLQARRDARKVLDTYREPLIAASYELQARLHNILCVQFVERYIKNENSEKRNAAIESTLYVFAQFFGWREVIRREIQYLHFSRDRETRQFNHLTRDIGEEFLTDRYGPQFMLWRVEQRGLGERMISSADGKVTCLGYASFLEHRNTMEEWLTPIEHDLENMDDGGRQRLREIQHLLLDLVKQLDDKQKRYPFKLDDA